MGETLGIFFVVGFFPLFFGFFLVVFARNLRKANDSLRWPSTSGQILSPRTRTVSYGGGDNARSGYAPYKEEEVLVVCYSYTVDGAEYSGERISYRGGSYDYSENAHAKYQPGDTVKVYYNPSDPSEAVLETGGRLGNFGCMVICMVIVFIFLFILLQAFIFDVILDR